MWSDEGAHSPSSSSSVVGSFVVCAVHIFLHVFCLSSIPSQFPSTRIPMPFGHSIQIMPSMNLFHCLYQTGAERIRAMERSECGWLAFFIHFILLLLFYHSSFRLSRGRRRRRLEMLHQISLCVRRFALTPRTQHRNSFRFCFESTSV